MNDYEDDVNRWYFENTLSITTAMIDGKEVQYDLCSSEYPQPAYDENKFRYIGAGYIYSINGIVQGYGPDDVMHFWVHKRFWVRK